MMASSLDFNPTRRNTHSLSGPEESPEDRTSRLEKYREQLEARLRESLNIGFVDVGLDIRARARDLALQDHHRLVETLERRGGLWAGIKKIWYTNIGREIDLGARTERYVELIKESGDIHAGERGMTDQEKQAENEALIKRFVDEEFDLLRHNRGTDIDNIGFESEHVKEAADKGGESARRRAIGEHRVSDQELMTEQGIQYERASGQARNLDHLKRDIVLACKQVAVGDITEEAFKKRTRDIIAQVATVAYQGKARNNNLETGLLDSGDLFVSNLQSLVQVFKDAHRAGIQLGELEANLVQFTIGRERSQIVDEARLTRFEKILTGMKKNKILGLVANETTVAAVALIGQLGAKITTTSLLSFFGGVAAATALAKKAEDARMEEERAHASREKAKGNDRLHATARTAGLEAVINDMRDCSDMTYYILTNVFVDGDHTQGYVWDNSEDPRQAVRAAVSAMAEAEMRMRFADAGNQVIRYSPRRVQQEHRELVLALARAEKAMREYDEHHPGAIAGVFNIPGASTYAEVLDHQMKLQKEKILNGEQPVNLQASRGDERVLIDGAPILENREKGIKEQRAAFEKLKSRRSRRKAVEVLVGGLVGGALVQEAGAHLFDAKGEVLGIGETFHGTEATRTSLRSAYEWLSSTNQHTVIVPTEHTPIGVSGASMMTDAYGNNAYMHLPKGYSVAPHIDDIGNTPIGHYDVIDSHGKILYSNYQPEIVNGALSVESVQDLYEHTGHRMISHGLTREVLPGATPESYVGNDTFIMTNHLDNGTGATFNADGSVASYNANGSELHLDFGGPNGCGFETDAQGNVTHYVLSVKRMLTDTAFNNEHSVGLANMIRDGQMQFFQTLDPSQHLHGAVQGSVLPVGTDGVIRISVGDDAAHLWSIETAPDSTPHAVFHGGQYGVHVPTSDGAVESVARQFGDASYAGNTEPVTVPVENFTGLDDVELDTQSPYFTPIITGRKPISSLKDPMTAPPRVIDNPLERRLDSRTLDPEVREFINRTPANGNERATQFMVRLRNGVPFTPQERAQLRAERDQNILAIEYAEAYDKDEKRELRRYLGYTERERELVVNSAKIGYSPAPNTQPGLNRQTQTPSQPAPKKKRWWNLWGLFS